MLHVASFRLTHNKQLSHLQYNETLFFLTLWGIEYTNKKIAYWRKTKHTSSFLI